MENTSNLPWTLIVSTRLYRTLLAVYPTDFRRAYGGPMLQVFRDSTRRALREGGSNGLLILWIRTLLDTVQAAIEQHSQRGVDMSKEKFIKFSGWALMLGGLAFTLGSLASSRPEYNQYNARSLAIDRYANTVETPLIIVGLLLLSAGFAGLLLRYGQTIGSFGRFCLGLGALSGVIGVVGALGLSIYDSEPWWSIFFLGTVAQFLALALFGIANLRQQALPRWNILPVLTGLWLPLLVLVSIITEQVNGQFVEMPAAAILAATLLTLAGLAGLGYLLQSDSRSAVTPAAAV